MKKIICFLLISVILLCSGCSKFVSLPETDDTLEPTYIEACNALKDGDYDKAYELFTQLGDYKDCKTHLSYFAYLPVEIISEDDGMGDEMVTYRTEFQYDKNGQLILRKGEYTNNEGPGFSEKYTYDEKGQLTKRETESEAGFSTYTYEYDNDGKLIKKVGCTDGANVGSITTYSYNENGNCFNIISKSYMGIDTADYQNQTPYHTDTYVYSYTSTDFPSPYCIEHIYGNEQITYDISYVKWPIPTTITSIDSEGFKNTISFEHDENAGAKKVITPYETIEFTYENSSGGPTSAIRTREGGKPCEITYKYKLIYQKFDSPKNSVLSDNVPFYLEEYESILML